MQVIYIREDEILPFITKATCKYGNLLAYSDAVCIAVDVPSVRRTISVHLVYKICVLLVWRGDYLFQH